MHASKVKDKMIDQLEKEAHAVKLMIEESLGCQNTITLEEVSELNFGQIRVVYKGLLQQNAPFS